jgi:hypothetical protein
VDRLREIGRSDKPLAERITDALTIGADSGLRRLGDHSSGRQVYALDGERVVKIAKNPSGAEQNVLEAMRSSSNRDVPFLAHVESADMRDGIWLVMERVEPLASADEYKRLTGEGFTATMDYVYDAVDGHPEGLRSPGPIAQRLADFVMAASVDPVEIDDLGMQWGKTHDGRAVLLDYGA